MHTALVVPYVDNYYVVKLFMFSLFLDNIILLWGLFALSFGFYKLVKNRGGLNYLLWFLGGLLTIAIIILDHTVLIDLTLSSQGQKVQYIKNMADAVLLVFWLYVAYREGFFKK